MIWKKLKSFYKNTVRLRRYNNVVEAAHWGKVVRRCSGTSVFEVASLPGNRIICSFSTVGFIFFLLWNSVYAYCTFVTYFYDQTILRMLYATKLRRYGDDFERATSLIYVLVTALLIPFKLSGNRKILQKIVDIDIRIESTGYILNYHKIACTALTISVAQAVTYIIRTVCIWLILKSSSMLPLEKMFQVVYSDTLALITTALYCYYIAILRDRFKWINITLTEIKTQRSWEYKVFVRSKVPTKIDKVVELQERQVCEKLRTCARVYSMLNKSCEDVATLFGLALLVTMLHYSYYLILYLFYFMEATASGLFHDVHRYFDFVIFTFWQIAIAIGIIFLIVSFSESTMKQAKKTSFILHEIVIEDLSKSITKDAMQFSIQLLHEKPTFTVCGLFNLTYSFLQEGARSVVTYLIILLQFVTENPSVS